MTITLAKMHSVSPLPISVAGCVEGVGHRPGAFACLAAPLQQMEQNWGCFLHGGVWGLSRLFRRLSEDHGPSMGRFLLVASLREQNSWGEQDFRGTMGHRFGGLTKQA